MDLITNYRLTDLGAIMFAIILTVAVFATVIGVERRSNLRSVKDAADLAAANEAGL